jgi:hypothetical protein
MKSLIFTILTLTAFAASALDEVAFDQNDAHPNDYLRYREEVRTKVIPHTNGRNYAVMYTHQNNGTTTSTKIIAMCNIGYIDTVEVCSKDQDPVLGEVHAALVQKSKADCSKIALLAHDHKTTTGRNNDYYSTVRNRDTESNVRAITPIVASYTWHVETLNALVPSINTAQSVLSTKQLLDDVANKRMPPDAAKFYLEQQAQIIKKEFISLLVASRCTEEDLRLCPFNKLTHGILTPQASTAHYANYNELVGLGHVEMRACSTAKSVAAPLEKQGPPAPEIKEPIITTPAIRSVEPQPEEAQAIDPTTVGN